MDKEENQYEVDRDLAAETAGAILFSDEGLSNLEQSLQGNDPVAVIAQVVFVTLQQVREKFRSNQTPLEDAVFLGEDGAIAEVLLAVFNYAKKQLGIELTEDDFDEAVSIIEGNIAQLVQAEAGPQQQAPAMGVASSLARGMQ